MKENAPRQYFLRTRSVFHLLGNLVGVLLCCYSEIFITYEKLNYSSLPFPSYLLLVVARP